MFSGQGKYYFSEQDKTYEGDFSENVFEGHGLLTYGDGKTYEGQFSNGMKQGNGTMHFPNGNRYIGGWLSDKQHGIGVLWNMQDGTKR